MRVELGKLELFGVDLGQLWQRWLRGINSLLPVPLADVFLRPAPRLRAYLGAEAIRFAQQLPGQPERELLQLSHSELAMLDDGSLYEQLVQGADKRLLQMDLVLPQEQALCKKINLPAAARGSVREALSFQIDKLTPFTRDQVYFDVLELGASQGGSTLETELQVVSKAFAEPWLQQLSRVTGLPVARLQVAGRHKGADAANLLGALTVPSLWLRRLNLNSYLVVFLAFMLAVAVLAPVVKLRMNVLLNKQEITRLDHQLGVTRQNWYELQKNVDGLDLMLAEHARSAKPTLILDELTQSIPDDVFLTAVLIDKGRVELSGMGQNVVNLVKTLNESEHFEQASFSSAITRDRSGLDVFVISMQLKSFGAQP